MTIKKDLIDMKKKLTILILFILSDISLAQQMPLLTYTPLSDEAKETNQLEQYKNIPITTKDISLDGAVLEIKVPARANAYDVIPINYTLKRKPYDGGWFAVEAVSLEDVKKVNDKPLYDLSVPGNMNVKIEYLGSISADCQNDKYIPLGPDPNTPISPFPPYKRDEMVKSSTIRAADAIWFKFRITNTGDTILDPEGFAGCFASPYLTKFDDKDEVEWKAQPVNLFERFLKYLYPGESVELWTNFHCPKLESNSGLVPGKYRIDYRLVCRFYDRYDWMANIWSGTEFARLEVPITVSKNFSQTPVQTTMKMVAPENHMPGYFAKFEEFMTSFNIYPYKFREDTVKDTIFLQVASWTKVVTVKLISNRPDGISVVRVPIEISTDSMAIKYNPRNNMVLNRNGIEEPIIISQSMPGMRSGFQLGPFPEKHMMEYLQEQKDLGINLISNTAGNWWIPEINGRKNVELSSACYKYFYDVLIRKLDMKVIGWSLYPPSGPGWYVNAQPLMGKMIDYAKGGIGGYQSDLAPTEFVDLSDPIVPEVIAAWVKYQYQRWGDTWYTTRDGRVPIEIEDTWGWLRDDINIRYAVGPLGIKEFKAWVKEKYETIEKTNAAWNSKYKDFNDINPQLGKAEKGGYCYDDPNLVFFDFSPACEDWDIFRTELRMKILRQANEIIRKTIPNAELSVRTEGANLVIRGDGKSDDIHSRHVYYSQRRNAMVYDVVKQRDILHFYSDYINLPYSQTQWRQAMSEMVSDGIIPMFLPAFGHMRDTLLNQYYGLEYTANYNLQQPGNGIMVHCLRAAYPWWKATYEEGGAPGIIWADYLCDGFATETQKRELKLLSENFKKMNIKNNNN
ncbi:MAG: beta-galactosidase [Phycisphaerales bacterium]